MRLKTQRELVGAPGFEPGTSCAQGKSNWSNSVILRHGWQRKRTLRHVRDTQVVLKWYLRHLRG